MHVIMNKCSCKGNPKIAEKPEGYYRFYVYCPICGKRTNLYPSKGGAQFNWDEYISSDRIKYEPILSDTDKNARHHADACQMMELYCQQHDYDLESASIVIDYVTLSETYVETVGDINVSRNEDVWNNVIDDYVKTNCITFDCCTLEQRLGRECKHAIESGGFIYSKKAEKALIERYKHDHEAPTSLALSASSVYEMKAWIARLVKIKQKSIQNQS